MGDIEQVWDRIALHEGQVFELEQGTPSSGREFTYAFQPGHIIPSRTKYNIAKANFVKALERVPLAQPTDIKDLRGSSYVYAILMDCRIRLNDW